MTREEFEQLLDDIQNAGGDIVAAPDWGPKRDMAVRIAENLKDQAMEEYDRLIEKMKSYQNHV